MKSTFRVLMIWLFLFGALGLIYTMTVGVPKNATRVPFSQLIKDIDEKGNVKKLVIHGEEYQWTYHDGQSFYAVGPIADDKLNTLFLKNKIEVQYKPHTNKSSFWQVILISWLPILLLLGFLFFMLRQLQGGRGPDPNGFGKINLRGDPSHRSKVTFEDVAGIDEVKEELVEIVEFLRDPKKYTRLGGRIPKGVLLMGAPGTGKTLLARSVAGEADVPFFSISGSDFVELFVGVGASRVRDLFEQAKKSAPCIIFIDEIDAVGRHRGIGLGGGNDEREQTLNQLLVEMDGIHSNEGVIIVAATNRSDILDPALQRPGRFDRQVMVPLPDVIGREAILHVHSKRIPLAEGTNLRDIAKGTPGFSGAELENLVNEAALFAAREDRDRVYTEHFEKAKDKVIMGQERRSMMLSEEEKEHTAVHEAGHALVGKLLEHCDPVHKVSIIPRGRALGVTMTLPDDDRKDVFEDYLYDLMAFAMGGRAADELIYNHKTAGASDDIRRVTGIARKMVCEWGMSEKLGPLSYKTGSDEPLVGRDISQGRPYSETTAQMIDEEVSRLVNDSYKKAVQLLSDNIDMLKTVSAALVERENISGDELDRLMRGESLPPLPLPPRSKGNETSEKSNSDAVAPIAVPEAG